MADHTLNTLLGGAGDRAEVAGMLHDTGVTAALGAGHLFDEHILYGKAGHRSRHP